MHPIDSLPSGRAFTISEAAAQGVSRRVLEGRRFRRLFRGVYVRSDLPLNLVVWLHAVRLLLPEDATVSHLSALRLLGHDPGGRHDLELSTTTDLRTRMQGVRLHRRRVDFPTETRHGLPVTRPDRTFVDCASTLGLIPLVVAAEHLVRTGLVDLAGLRTYCRDQRIDGVVRARRAAALARAGAESPKETVLRLMLVFARLPEPEINVEIRDATERFVARVDLLLAPWKVVVEYDGRHHETDASQWARDRRRREALEALGYRVIVVAAADLRSPRQVPWRVFNALVQRGYDGSRPVTSDQWGRWFGAA